MRSTQSSPCLPSSRVNSVAGKGKEEQSNSLADMSCFKPWMTSSSSSSGHIPLSPTCPRHGPIVQVALKGGTLFDGLPNDKCTVRLAFALGICKLLCGVVVVILGMSALVFQSTLAGIGAGMWAGMIALVAGFVGMLSSRLPESYATLVAFLCWSISSLAASGLLAVFSITGLCRDLMELHSSHTNWTSTTTTAMNSTKFDLELDLSTPIYLIPFLVDSKRPAMILNAALVTLAVVDSLLSVACIVLTSLEACVCNSNSGPELVWGGRAERKARQDRLLNWIDQQQIQLFVEVSRSESWRTAFGH